MFENTHAKPPPLLRARNIALTSWLPIIAAVVINQHWGNSHTTLIVKLWFLGVALQLTSAIFRYREKKLVRRAQSKEDADYLTMDK